MCVDVRVLLVGLKLNTYYNGTSYSYGLNIHKVNVKTRLFLIGVNKNENNLSTVRL